MLPILGNVLIETTDAGLLLSATDLTSRLRALVPGKVEEQGATTVDIKTLVHLLGQFDKVSKADLLLDGDYLLVADGEGTSGRLPTIAADEMPIRLDTSKWTVVTNFDAQALQVLIERSLPFVAHDEARPILTGVSVHTTPAGNGGAKATFGAADNYVVSGLDTAEISINTVESVATIPAASLKLLAGLLGDYSAEVVEYRLDVQNERGVRANFAVGPYDLTVQCIDGQFPKYEEVIPRYSAFNGETGSYGITVDRKAFLKALKLARKADFVVHLVTGPDSVAVVIPSYDSKGNDALFAKSLPATIIPPRDEKIGFKPELLNRVLNTVSAPTVTLFRNGENVASAYGVETGDPASRYAVMPVKLA
jgi:DNA polymerase III sliding clamp (beta) subunit (PCNA family)